MPADSLLSIKLIAARDRLIFALDVPTKDDALAWIDRLGDAVTFYKLGLEFCMSGHYFELLAELSARGKKVFADLKFSDVPATVRGAVVALARHGAACCTLHGTSSVYRAVVPVKGAMQLLAVTVLTSVDEAEVREMGWNGPVEELVSLRARRAIDAGIDGLICSGREAARLRRELGSGPLIITPGIRGAAERGSDDQKRTMTLREAFLAGADHIVVGRPIRNAPDPRVAAEAMQAEIASYSRLAYDSNAACEPPGILPKLRRLMSDSQYAHPEVLRSTDWLAAHLNDPTIRIVESNEDVLLYDTGHIPGAVHIDWRQDLQDPLVRDYISPEAFAALAAKNGIGPDTTVLFYGDKSNWWACYALWAFRLFGHTNVQILDGGRDKWIKEGRQLTKEKPKFPAANYPVPAKRFDDEIRAFYEEALAQSLEARPLIDVRSPGEFRGEVTHMPEYPQEGVLRGGHIPGAKSVPWKTAVKDDATFKPVEELRKIYTEGCELKPDKDIIAYCRIGERSSHTWFVLTYLLGYDKVRNYDGSWTEWGNKVRAPIERS